MYAGRTGVFASPTTRGNPLHHSTRSNRFSTRPCLKVTSVEIIHWFDESSSGWSKSISRTVVCSPFGPKGMDFCPVSQAMNSSLATTGCGLVRAEIRIARRL